MGDQVAAKLADRTQRSVSSHGARPSEEALPAGTVVDRYVIRERLGAGAMGVVYRAEHRAMKRDVALKVLHAELARVPEMAMRFEREAQLVSRIHSPHVVLVHDCGAVPEGPRFIAMELLRGQTLASRLRAGPLRPQDACRVAADVARALAAAHASRVVHRDLKPENVISCTDGVTRVVDFGIAKVDSADALAEEARLTRHGSFIGTAHYMSPEACAGRPVGAATDLYALGVMLFEMWTGQVPFDAEGFVLVLGLHLRAPVPRLEETRPDLACVEGAQSLLDDLLAKAPDARPSAAAAIGRLEALEAAFVRAAPAIVLQGPVSPVPTGVVARPTSRAPSEADGWSCAVRGDPSGKHVIRDLGGRHGRGDARPGTFPPPIPPMIPEGATFALGESPFRVSGALYLGTSTYFQRRAPGGAAALLSEIGPGPLADFVGQRFSARAWYDAIPIARLVAHEARALALDLQTYLEERTRWQVAEDLHGVHRVLLRVASPARVMARLPKVVSQTFEFARLELEHPDRGAQQACVHGVPVPLEAYLRIALTTYLEVALELAGAQSARVRCIDAFDEGRRAGVTTRGIRLRAAWR